MRYIVTSLDVIGNEIQGWEINDKYKIGTIDLTEEVIEDNDLIFAVLNESGYMDIDATSMYEVDGPDNELTILSFETGRPLLQLSLDYFSR